ncbi:MAG: serine hydrolase domain-containing protein [Acidobacteriota bacterium]
MPTKLDHPLFPIDPIHRSARWRPVLAAVAGWLLLSAASVAAEAAAWGSEGCPSRVAMRQIVDQAFAATPAGELIPGRGSGAPGYSVAVSNAECGRFRYAVGQRDVERGRAMTVRTRHHLGSLTKVLTAVVVLRLDAAGHFGPAGLDTPLDDILSEIELAALTVGPDVTAPRCPSDIRAIDRSTGGWRAIVAECPDFSRITLRHLLAGHHGLLDFVTEVDRDANGILDSDQLALGSLFEALGVTRLDLPSDAGSAFDLLAATGVLADPEATIGGHRRADFEVSFGNTGYTLLGLAAERVTGRPLNALFARWLGRCSGDGVAVLTAPPMSDGRIARQFLVTSGADDVGLPEDLFGVYPQSSLAGHPAVDVYDLDAFLITNSGGGAGAGVATPTRFRQIVDALLGGRLSEPKAQQEFDRGFVTIDELPGVEHGFGLFRFTDPEFGPGYAKSGRVTGSTCQLLHFTDPATTVVACRNSADAFLGDARPPTSTPVADLARDLVRAVRASESDGGR